MGDWLSSYTRFLARFKRSVCLIWLAILAGGIVGVVRQRSRLLAGNACSMPPSLVSSVLRLSSLYSHSAQVNVFPSLKLTVDAVPGDVNEIAHSATRSAFTQADGFQSTIVLLTASDGVTNLTALPAARQVAERCSAVAGPYISSGLLTSDSGASFFSYNDTGLTLLAAGFVAGNGSEMIVSFTTTVGALLLCQPASANLSDSWLAHSAYRVRHYARIYGLPSQAALRAVERPQRRGRHLERRRYRRPGRHLRQHILHPAGRGGERQHHCQHLFPPARNGASLAPPHCVCIRQPGGRFWRRVPPHLATHHFDERA